MFSLLLKPFGKSRRQAQQRKASNLLDIGSGERPCTDCAFRVKIGYDAWDHGPLVKSSGCSRFVDCVTGNTTPCRIARVTRGMCGTEGAGFVSVDDVATASSDLPELLAPDDSTLQSKQAGLNPSAPVVDIMNGGAVCIGCTECEFPHDASTPYRCARWIDSTTGTPVRCTEARNDASVCGSSGLGWEARTKEQLADDALRYGESGDYIGSVL